MAAHTGSNAAPIKPALSGRSSTVRPSVFRITMCRTLPSLTSPLTVSASCPASTRISSLQLRCSLTCAPGSGLRERGPRGGSDPTESDRPEFRPVRSMCEISLRRAEHYPPAIARPPMTFSRAGFGALLALLLVGACAGDDPDRDAFRGPGLHAAKLQADSRARAYEAAIRTAFDLEDPGVSILIDDRVLPRAAGVDS